MKRLLETPGYNFVRKSSNKQRTKQNKITLLDYMAAILYYLGAVNTWPGGNSQKECFFNYRTLTKMLFKDRVHI